MSTGPTASPFTYTVDLTRVFLSAVAALAFLGGLYFYYTPRPTAPFVQPSVPGLIPPQLSCLCGTTKQRSAAPFFVVCPNCRNTLTVQASAKDAETGHVIGTVGKPSPVVK